MERFKKIYKIYDYFNFFASFGFEKYFRFKASRILKGFVLDAGCGKGEFTEFILRNKKVKKVVGIDITKEMVKERNKKLDSYFLLGDVHEMPFKEGKFDFVASAFLYRNINPERFFKECKRVLKKNGKILILEMGLPDFFIIKFFYLIYLKFLEILTHLIFKKEISKEYKFLFESIKKFNKGEEIKKYFKNLKVLRINFGFAYIFILGYNNTL
ncbi:MAG: class I SAM-dependent methyltransferase [candidate division WOR-3 bacterium]